MKLSIKNRAVTLIPLLLVFLLISGYFLVLSQGLVLWDDDYGLWQKQLSGLSWWQVIVERLLSPFPYTETEWGFTERALQLFAYKILFSIDDKGSFVFFFYKSLSFGALALVLWVLLNRLAIRSWIKIMTLVLLFTAPNTIAAFTWHADFAPTAEFLYLTCLLVFINLIENFNAKNSKEFFTNRRQLLQWLGFCLLVFISYKSKANPKLLPLIFIGGLLLTKPKLLATLAAPLGLLLLLALPWSKATFTKLPPWFPGSGGSSADWMFQESGVLGQAYNLLAGMPDAKASILSVDFYPLSIAEVLGVVIFIILLFLLLNLTFKINSIAESNDSKNFQALPIALVWLWFFAELAGSTALSEINYFYRVRYTFILLLPFCILLALFTERLLQSAAFYRQNWQRNLLFLLLAFCVFYQAKLNLVRGLQYRSSLGGVMSVVDQAYRHVDRNLPTAKLFLLPGFLNYAAPQNSSTALAERTPLSDLTELSGVKPDATYGLAWGVEPISGFSLIKTFTGCSSPGLLNFRGSCENHLSLYRLN